MEQHSNQISPKVGVVILNYNQAAVTMKCVSSFLEYETYANYSVVVVDNASPKEEEKEMLQRGLPSSIPIIWSGENRGYAAGNNLGFHFWTSKEGYEYVLVLNSDTFLTKPIIADLLKGMKDIVGCVAISPLVINPANKENWKRTVQVRKLLSFNKIMICNTTLLRRLPVFRSWFHSYIYAEYMPWDGNVLEVDTINGASFLIHLPTVSDIGYLDERTFLYYEELILGRQIALRGKKCALHTGVIIMHAQGASTGEGQKNISVDLEKMKLSSFDVLGRSYYHQAGWKLKLFRIYRLFEIHIKRVLQWIG